MIQGDQDIISVLDSIDGCYNALQWYDASDATDPWKHYKIGKTFGNDLFEINETMAFWIHITQLGDTIFVYNGSTPAATQSITLYPGWNLVGYPSLTSHIRTDGLNNLNFLTDVDCIQWYNASSATWHIMGSDDYFEKGVGYWIHTKDNIVWDVPL
jgi:hypothetical protein